MADIVTMPKLGFDMAEGTLVRWVIAEGEAVQKGAVLAEIETDKATVEVESAYDGLIVRHLVTQGTVVPVNAPIAVVGAPGEVVNLETLLGETPAVRSEAPAEQPPELAPPETQTPEPGSPEKPAPEPTTPEIQVPKPGVTVEHQIFPVVSDVPSLGGFRASPLARHLAEEKGIELNKIKGTGPGGRITKRDVEGFIEPPVPVTEPTRVIGPTSTLPTYLAGGLPAEDRVIPLSRLRATIARRTAESTQQIPHFYVTHDFAMDALMDIRKQMNSLLPEGEKLSVNDFIIKAAALALTEFPNLNASINLEKDQLIQHGQVNVGVAVAVPNGLLTVVSRDTPRKSLRQISSEIQTMVIRARDGKVRPDDIEGSTFTVSNLGMFDVDQFTAIINSPEAAILAVGSVKQIPVIVEGQIRPGLRMKATLSVDHRVSDGIEGAKFLQSLGKYLEAPLVLLL